MASPYAHHIAPSQSYEPRADELDIAMRADTGVGTEEQFAKLTGESQASDGWASSSSRCRLPLRAAIAITDCGLRSLPGIRA